VGDTVPPGLTPRKVGWRSADADERFQLLIFFLGWRLKVPSLDVRFFMFPRKSDRQKAEARLDGAVALLKQYTPLRLSYLQTDLPKLSIFPAGAALARCYHRIRLCLLDEEYLLSDRTSSVDLALTLVHEGTHARLARNGFRYLDARRARIERICYAAQLIVARRIPGGDEAVRSSEGSLAASDDYYSRSVQRMRELRRGATLLKDLGWLARPVWWFATSLGWVLRGWRRRPPSP